MFLVITRDLNGYFFQFHCVGLLIYGTFEILLYFLFSLVRGIIIGDNYGHFLSNKSCIRTLSPSGRLTITYETL